MNEDLRDSLTQVIPPSADPGGGDPMEAHLVALSGPRQGMVHVLAAPQTTIGRKPFNDIVLPAVGVSKTHCTLVKEDGRHYVLDNDSTNGTYVNGRPIPAGARLQLTHGDTLGVFDTSFLFVAPRHDADEAPPRVDVDFESAAREAAELLSDGAEAMKLRRARRERAGT